jgi:2',3'-cyclic-nucleotide 2'-phosphodiesterase (5'-nucleotidase family)
MSNESLDFVVLNGGGFRTTWYPGVIRYAELFSMFPFKNNVETFTMTGLNLKKMIQTIQNGVKKFYPTWGLSQTFTNNSGSYTLTSLKLANGDEVIDGNNYKGASITFCLQGGDDFSTAISNGVTFQNRAIYPVNQT